MGVSPRLRERWWALAAGVVITASVVGLPLLTSGSLSGSGSSGPSAAGTTTTTSPPGPTGPAGTTAPAGVTAAPVDDDFLGLLQALSAPPTTTTTTAAANTGPASPTTTATTALTTGPSTPTTTVAARPRPTPRAPTGLALDFTGTALAVRWGAVTQESDGSPFTGGYELELGSGAVTKTYQLNSSTFTYTLDQNRADFGTPQAELTVGVRAVDLAGTAGAPAAAVAVHEPPATPAAPPILAPGPGAITVIGQLPAGVTDLAGFDIYEYEPGSSPSYVFLGSTIGIAAFVHDALVPGSTHTYVYRTRDVFGQTSAGYSPAATATAS